MNETNVYIGDYKALKISFPQKQNKRKNGAINMSGDNDKKHYRF